MKVIVAGGRDFYNVPFMFAELDRLLAVPIHNGRKVTIVSGGAKGADECGLWYANIRNLPTHVFHPDWDKHGKSAGMLRNVDMADDADMLIAFWDMESRGTKHMIDTARAKNLKTHIFYYHKDDLI